MKACVAVDGHVPTRGWEKIAVFLKLEIKF